MRKLRLLNMAVVLVLALGVPAFAGITDTPPEPPPPPGASVTATGITDTPPSARATSDASDSLIDLTLTVLQSVLSVF
jgi:hypothetical protein